MKHRKTYYQIQDLLSRSEGSPVIVLVGLRKVGKTTALKTLSHDVNGLYHNCQDKADFPEVIRGFFESDKAFLCLDEIGNITQFDEFVENLQQDLVDTGKKLIITSSSYGAMRQLSTGRLGARCYMVEMFPLSFEEYLYFSNKISKYGEAYEPTAADIEDFYRLKDIPSLMRFIINEDYMRGVFDEAVISHQNQLSIVQDIVLNETECMTVIDILAYSLNEKIPMKRFDKYNLESIGGQEFGYRHFSMDLSPAIVYKAHKLSPHISPERLAKIIAYMYYNGFLFIDTVMNEDFCQNPYDACKSLAEVRTRKDLEVILSEYTFSVVSPLLYTRLLADVERIVDELVHYPRIAGKLFELTFKSEALYKDGFKLHHTSRKYQTSDPLTKNVTAEVDLIVTNSSNMPNTIVELTTDASTKTKHHLMEVFPDIEVRRILTDTPGTYQKDNKAFWRIGYPKALLMASDDNYYPELHP